MTVEQLIREANAYTGDDLGRTVFAQARDALLSGGDREELIATVTALYVYLGEAGREDDQDRVAEVLDSLTGFCSPTAAL